MTPDMPDRTSSKGMLWAGRIISAFPVLMMGVLGLVMFFFFPDQMNKGMAKYHYPPAAMRIVFIVELICVVIYVIPQTAVLGAILLTGYLGGAIATHVQAGENSQIWFPVFFAGLIWLGLYLRDARIRALIPFR